eukprot:CAMPEP_0174739828 /NCGR_PEP_ID=MMETSP1094-20130205/72241_1 /TAXON_ID=156173 /ORGANISM="Chrysochromulina brevifilum, Strain UTEX LB 985" /LENGTH=238 /DNA_ID=CAMNT_0015943429 /DNA_START=189 /DNA_END=901 /DNA_ORIENTATION=+
MSAGLIKPASRRLFLGESAAEDDGILTMIRHAVLRHAAATRLPAAAKIGVLQRPAVSNALVSSVLHTRLHVISFTQWTPLHCCPLLQLPAGRDLGISWSEWSDRDGGREVLDVDPHSPAAEAGVLPGWRLRTNGEGVHLVERDTMDRIREATSVPLEGERLLVFESPLEEEAVARSLYAGTTTLAKPSRTLERRPSSWVVCPKCGGGGCDDCVNKGRVWESTSTGTPKLLWPAPLPPP